MMRFGLPLGASESDALASVAFVFVLLVGWWLIGRALQHGDDLSSQAAGRWTANVRNALILIAVIGLFMIWAPQLRTFALSLTAVAVAIVIATKELILCLSGSAYRTFTQAYTTGDIVEIGACRGQVKDITLLSTKMIELDSGEGSLRLASALVTVPHSLLFSTPARLIGRKGAKAEHVFRLVFEPEVDLFSRFDELEQIAATARPSLSGEGQDEPVDAVGPNLTLTTTELGKLKLEVRTMAAPENAEEIERSITNAVGAFVLSQCNPTNLQIQP